MGRIDKSSISALFLMAQNGDIPPHVLLNILKELQRLYTLEDNINKLLAQFKGE